MSQSINSLPVGALVKDTGTTAKYTTNNTVMTWRIIGKNHDATNSVTLESKNAILPLPKGSDGNIQAMSDTQFQVPSFVANAVSFSNDFDAKIKSITKKYFIVTKSGNNWTSSLVNRTGKVHAIGYTEVNGSAISFQGTNYIDGTRYEFYASGGLLPLTIISGSFTSNDGNDSTRIYATARSHMGGSIFGVVKAGWNLNPSQPQRNFSQLDLFSPYYIAPVICISNDIRVSDTTDSDGAYTVVWNTPPRISTPSTDLGDRTKAFSTTFQVADDEADTVSATINLDSTTIQTIASVTLNTDVTIAIDATTFRNLTLGSHTITITANDGTESVTTTISFQKVSGMGISGSDGDLGNIWMQPTITYQVYDDNDLQVDITEKIDGEIVKELEDAPLNTDITFDMSAFNDLTPEEQHTLKIEAVNADESTAERTWTFTKLYQYLQFYTDTVETDISAERIYVVLDYDKTNDPEIEVWVCNDAGGYEWHYEDATEDVLNGQPHTFHYVPAEGTEGVSVMVRLIKNENTERVYFNNIGFTFS